MQNAPQEMSHNIAGALKEGRLYCIGDINQWAHRTQCAMPYYMGSNNGREGVTYWHKDVQKVSSCKACNSEANVGRFICVLSHQAGSVF